MVAASGGSVPINYSKAVGSYSPSDLRRAYSVEAGKKAGDIVREWRESEKPTPESLKSKAEVVVMSQEVVRKYGGESSLKQGGFGGVQGGVVTGTVSANKQGVVGKLLSSARQSEAALKLPDLGAWQRTKLGFETVGLYGVGYTAAVVPSAVAVSKFLYKGVSRPTETSVNVGLAASSTWSKRYGVQSQIMTQAPSSGEIAGFGLSVAATSVAGGAVIKGGQFALKGVFGKPPATLVPSSAASLGENKLTVLGSRGNYYGVVGNQAKFTAESKVLDIRYGKQTGKIFADVQKGGFNVPSKGGSLFVTQTELNLKYVPEFGEVKSLSLSGRGLEKVVGSEGQVKGFDVFKKVSPQGKKLSDMVVTKYGGKSFLESGELQRYVYSGVGMEVKGGKAAAPTTFFGEIMKETGSVRTESVTKIFGETRGISQISKEFVVPQESANILGVSKVRGKSLGVSGVGELVSLSKEQPLTAITVGQVKAISESLVIQKSVSSSLVGGKELGVGGVLGLSSKGVGVASIKGVGVSGGVFSVPSGVALTNLKGVSGSKSKSFFGVVPMAGVAVSPISQFRYSTESAIKPELKPALMPTLKPALMPSVRPIIASALIPALMPTMKPELKPALMPTLKPSLMPPIIPITTTTIIPSGFGGGLSLPFGTSRRHKDKRKDHRSVFGTSFVPMYVASVSASTLKIRGRKNWVSQITGLGVRPIAW